MSIQTQIDRIESAKSDIGAAIAGKGVSVPGGTKIDGMAQLIASIPEKIDTSGTATAADIYTGKTATVSDVKITGTNPYNAANVDPAVTSALAAIAEKGVDTTGAGLADIAGLVAAIESGGGGIPVAVGSFTLAEVKKNYTVTHGLGVTPDFAIFVNQSSYSNVDNTKRVAYAYAYEKLSQVLYTQGSYYNSGRGSSSQPTTTTVDEIAALSNSYKNGTGVFDANENTITFGTIDDGTYGLSNSGLYIWIVAKVGVVY